MPSLLPTGYQMYVGGSLQAGANTPPSGTSGCHLMTSPGRLQSGACFLRHATLPTPSHNLASLGIVAPNPTAQTQI